jgi:SAM-dependent methyltransferase
MKRARRGPLGWIADRVARGGLTFLAAAPGRRPLESAETRRLRRIPLDRRSLLNVGCGAGVRSAAIARQLPSTKVVEVDLGIASAATLGRADGGSRVPSAAEGLAERSFADGAFDCVYAEDRLEHAGDITRTLAEIGRVLAPGGVLICAIPADALDSNRVCDHHTWRTARRDIRARLEHAGFAGVEIAEFPSDRRFIGALRPPSRGTVLHVRAWLSPMTASRASRAAELTRWAYAALDPSRTQSSHDPLAILADGHAWCWGYVLVLGEALWREGFDVRWGTMLSDRHPDAIEFGRTQSHEVLEVAVDGGARHVLDPMVGVVFPCSLGELLADPARADVSRVEDARYRERGYALYSTAAWYQCVDLVAMRDRPDERPHFKPAAVFAIGATQLGPRG